VFTIKLLQGYRATVSLSFEAFFVLQLQDLQRHRMTHRTLYRKKRELLTQESQNDFSNPA
jgi:hypothetical protein